MVIAVTLTMIAAYDPVDHKFVALSIHPDLQAEVYGAIELIRRDMLDDNDLAMLISRQPTKPRKQPLEALRPHKQLQEL